MKPMMVVTPSPVDTGVLHILDEPDQEKKGHHDKRKNDDRSDHATPSLRRLHLHHM